MALQANGITVLRVGTREYLGGQTAPMIEFLVGSAQVMLIWDDRGHFIRRPPMWSDGRRGAEAPEFTAAEWAEILRQAYGIAKSRKEFVSRGMP